MYKNEINCVNDVKGFFDYLTDVMSINFHPDTFFSEYINSKRMVLFTSDEAGYYGSLMDRAFTVCQSAEVDIYATGINSLLN